MIFGRYERSEHAPLSLPGADCLSWVIGHEAYRDSRAIGLLVYRQSDSRPCFPVTLQATVAH